MAWPQEISAELASFYGPFVLGANGKPTATWERDHMQTIVCPYPLRLSWDLSQRVSRLTCHRKVADSLRTILANIVAHYETIDEVKNVRMDMYGGCYEFRRIAGSSRLSLHAYGAAIDLDPEHNPLGKPYVVGAAMIPREVVDIFKAEGWKWGGDFTTRADCMHFQATS